MRPVTRRLLEFTVCVTTALFFSYLILQARW